MNTGTHKEDVCRRLTEAGIPFERYDHQPVHTMAECLALPYTAPDVTFCKNILLCNRQKTDWYLFLSPPEKPFVTRNVSKALGVSRLSFAPQEALPEMLGLESGSLSPLALWYDRERKIRLVLDRDIRKEGRIAFHPCDFTATLIFRQEDFFGRVIPALGREPVWIEVPWTEAEHG